MNRNKLAGVVVLLSFVTFGMTGLADAQDRKKPARAKIKAPSTPRTLDGSANHPSDTARGSANVIYRRVAPHQYADDTGQMVSLPNSRYISNRIFNDSAQNLFSENAVTQWAAAWGQFVDHSIGLRDQAEGESAPISFDSFDPLEEFQNDLGAISFTRTAVAPGTGSSSPREQLNIVSSYLDAWAVYGGDEDRLEWMREGPVDGDMTNNSALMLTTDAGYLPRATARDAATAPAMELVGGLRFAPDSRVIAGDVRANENVALTAIQTLFVREHNRIVNSLPANLTEEQKFQIARRVTGALQQRITYREFLPALGVKLRRYRGYRQGVDATVSNEFAGVGYRAHSMIHGEIEVDAGLDDFSQEQLDELKASGVEVEVVDDGVEIAVPLNIAFANPDLVEQIGLGHILAGLAGESQYKNDEQIDNQLRSVMFQIPRPDTERPTDCLDGEFLSDCYTSVMDLAALDIERGRDHGIASYNDLRRAYGLKPAATFMELTGESTEDFPAEIAEGAVDPIDNPDILLFDRLEDIDGNEIQAGTDAAEGEAVVGVRRSTLAARLKAIYGDIDKVDGFVGMSAEPHVPGTEFGKLQLKMWKKQFQVLRDGDRYFYLNDPQLKRIERLYGVSYRRTLAQVIADNTDVELGDLPTNVFDGTTRSTANADNGVSGSLDANGQAGHGRPNSRRPDGRRPARRN